MKILKKIAVRIIPAAVLAFIITATVAYQRGVYDITFIERPPESSDIATTDVSGSETTPDEVTADNSTDTSTEVSTGADTTDEVTTSPEVVEADPIEQFIKRLETTESAVGKGYTVTDAEYGSGIKLTLLEPEQRIANRFTLRKMTEEYPVRVENETDTGYTTEYREREVDRPLVDVYMDYILVDNGKTVTALNNEGKILYSGFDVEKYVPAYTRDSDNIAQFKVTIPPANIYSSETVEYYMFDETGDFVKSDYNDAAETRGIYINYPSYYGLSDGDYVRYYQNGLYGYGTRSGAMSTYFKYPMAYNYSEGLAAVTDASGVLTYIQRWFYNQISGYDYFPNSSSRWVKSYYYLPDEKGIESLGFIYFDHGLCRVRKRIYDGYHESQIVSDTDIVITPTGEEFLTPRDYTVKAYSNGVFLLEKDGYYGFWDYTGKWIAQPIYDYAEPFSEGLAVVSIDGSYGLIDTDGDFVIPMIFDYIQSPSGGIIAAHSYSGWTLFNKVTR